MMFTNGIWPQRMKFITRGHQSISELRINFRIAYQSQSYTAFWIYRKLKVNYLKKNINITRNREREVLLQLLYFNYGYIFDEAHSRAPSKGW